MIKKFSKRAMAILLLLTILLSSNVYSVSAAGFKGALATFGTNKLLDFGYRTTAKIINVSLNAIGDATGNEEVNKAASLINTILMGGTGKSLKNIQSLCGEILSEIKDLKVDIYDCFSVVEKMLGEDRVKEAKKEVDEKWKEYITDVIDQNKATLACNYLDDYIDSALNYSKDPNNNTYKVAYEDNLELMMHGFAQMCKEDVPSSAYKDENMYGAKKIIFGGTSVDDSLMVLVDQFSSNLTKNSNQSITLAECAADMAYEYFPFSHQQYQYVNTVIGDQLTELSMCMLLASEYFDMKGEFILEEYGEDSDEYAGYMNTLKIYQNTILKNVNNRINEMLEAEMTVGISTKIKLNDYMRSEDAKDSVTLKIDDYLDSYKLKVSEGSGEYYEYYTITSNPVYIDKYLNFKRVMTHANGDNTVYYIIDPWQFSNSDTLKCLSLDYKYDVKFAPDDHITSCDFQNLIKKMTDGTNTFAVPNDGDKLLNLFGTNAFSLSSRCPDNYLADYLSSKNDDTVFYFLTSDYRNISHSSSVSTSYGELYLIYGSEAVSGTEIKSNYVSLKDFQSDNNGDIYKYSAILTNQNDTYQQTAHLQTKGNGVSSAQIVNEGRSITVNSGESKKINSGNKLTIKFKLNDGAEFKSLKCVRNSDAVNNNGTTTETVLLDKDDINLRTLDGDGYYSFEYPMPYSDATFVVEAIKHFFDDNGFCTECGAYQPAILNSQGVYEISNAGQLYWFSSLVSGNDTLEDFDSQDGSANAVLVKDIVVNNGDISKLASTQSGSLRKWIPIGTPDNSYTGKFDGQRHTISGLYFSDKNADNVGLAGYTRGGANIYNVGIINSYFEGRNSVGAVLGRNNNSGVTVQRCFSEATVIGSEGVGGIAGSTYGGKILDCYNAGSVTGSKYVASIRGKNTYNTTSSGAINNCFNVGEVKGTGSSNIGGIRGDGNGTISNCYCISTHLTDTSATTKTPEQFASGEVAYLLNHEVTNGTQVWYQNIDNGKTPDDYPLFEGGTVYFGYTCGNESKIYSNNKLSDEPSEHKFNDNGFCINCGAYQPAILNSNSVYEIGNAGQLFWFASLVNGDRTHAYFDEQNQTADGVLIKDIDLESREWLPIMNFSGTFDGADYTISSLKITNTSTYSGLFGKASGTIKSFTLKGDITLSTDGDKIGDVAESADGATVSDLVSYVNISNTDGVLHHIGGVVGCIENNETIVDKCVYYGTVDIKNSTDCIGGIVGYTNGGARISNCANHGTVSASKEGAYTGGILGYVNNTNPTVKDCYNYGKVSNGEPQPIAEQL